jgi:FkbM family methyltransferase
MNLRALAEATTHGWVFSRKLPPPYRQVRLVVSSDAGLRYLKPRLTNVDPILLRLVTEFVEPGSTVWDIGANVGLFAYTAAHRAGATGHVVAVEADTWNVALLRRSKFLQGPASAKVDVVPVAISDVDGFARFNIAVRSRSTNHLDGYGSTQTGGVRETQVVPSVTLDRLLDHFPAPDVLKIDIEGAEVLALAGAAAVLERRPIIICEVEARNATAVRDLLQPYGYHFYDGDVAGASAPLDDPPYSTVALPEVAQSAKPAPAP